MLCGSFRCQQKRKRFSFQLCLKVPVAAASWQPHIPLPCKSGSYILLWIASHLRVSTNTRRPLNAALFRTKTQRYHWWSFAEVMLSSARQFLCSYSHVGCGSLLFRTVQDHTNKTHKSFASTILFKLVQHFNFCPTNSSKTSVFKYHRLWLLSVCAYNVRSQRTMRLTNRCACLYTRPSMPIIDHVTYLRSNSKAANIKQD